MSARTKARKRAVDALFAADLREEHPAALLDETYKQVEDRQNQGPIFDYARTLIDGVVEHQGEQQSECELQENRRHREGSIWYCL